MLKRALTLCFGFVAATSAVAAPAPALPTASPAASISEPSGGPREPLQLTAGEGDQLLGILSPDEKRVYYVSNENGTTQLFSQSLKRRTPQLLFDEAADVTWPRISPDGQRLLYISYRTEAGGQVCERPLHSDGSAGAPRCYGGTRAERQALFWPGKKGALTAVAAVRRTEEGRLELVRLDGEGRATTLLGRTLSSPAVSPDGRWLVYSPLDAASAGVDVALAARARELTIAPVSADAVSVGEAKPLALAVPGMSASPIFSPDGRYLYFTQFVDDTNFDGQVDGNDHAVLYRVPFDGAAGRPAGPAEQLTDAAWNCQYPSVGKSKLVMTCLKESLDLYSLPLDGAIPTTWSATQLGDELAASRLPWERLLILGRLVDKVRGAPRARALAEIVRQHLLLGEYESAAFYARLLSEVELPEDAAQAADAHALGRVLGELINHRRAERALGHGELSDEFLKGVAERRARLQPLIDGAGDARYLATIVASEMADVSGDKGQAQKLVEQIPVARVRSSTVLYMLRERGTTIYRQLEEGAALSHLYAELAAAPGFDEPAQLESALLYVRQQIRGVPWAVADERLESAHASAVGAIRFALDLEQLLRRLDRLTAQATDKAPLDKAAFGDSAQKLLALYHAEPSFARRQLLIEEGMAREISHDRVLFDLASAWMADVGPERAERRHAERLFRQVVRERGYDQWAKGATLPAHDSFAAVTARVPTGLESQEGYVETDPDPSAQARLAALAEVAQKEPAHGAGHSGQAISDFMQAYQIARQLPALADEKTVVKLADQAIALLTRAEGYLPGRAEINLLWAHVAHQRYLRTRDLADALEAGARYHMTVELSEDHVRMHTSALDGIALLEEEVGNFELALVAADERRQLPFYDPRGELSVCLSSARALFHMDRLDDALGRAQKCRELIDKQPALGHYLPLALDRQGMIAAGADHPEVAAKSYGELLGMLPQPSPLALGASKSESHAPTLRVRNRFVAALGLAGAEVHNQHPAEAQKALAVADRLLDDPRAVAPPRTRYGKPAPGTEGRTADALRLQYRLVLDGLWGMALTQSGDLAGARARISSRCQRLETRLPRHADEDLVDLALCHARLGENALARKALTDAESEFRRALEWQDRYVAATGTPVDALGIHLLGKYLELHRRHGLPLAQLQLDVVTRLTTLLSATGKAHNPAWSLFGERFLVELTRLELEGAQPKAAVVTAQAKR